jgi:hypothetical protein
MDGGSGAPAAPRPLAVPGLGASTPGRSTIASPDAGLLTPSTYSTPKDTMVFLEYQAVGVFLVRQLSLPCVTSNLPKPAARPLVRLVRDVSVKMLVVVDSEGCGVGCGARARVVHARDDAPVTTSPRALFPSLLGPPLRPRLDFPGRVQPHPQPVPVPGSEHPSFPRLHLCTWSVVRAVGVAQFEEISCFPH